MAIYEYRAKCLQVISGLTVELGVDLGFGIEMVRKFDLAGVVLFAPSSEVKARVRQLLFAVPEDNNFPHDLLIHTAEAGRSAKVMVLDRSPPLTAWKSVQGYLLEEGLVLREKV